MLPVTLPCRSSTPIAPQKTFLPPLPLQPLLSDCHALLITVGVSFNGPGFSLDNQLSFHYPSRAILVNVRCTRITAFCRCNASSDVRSGSSRDHPVTSIACFPHSGCRSLTNPVCMRTRCVSLPFVCSSATYAQATSAGCLGASFFFTIVSIELHLTSLSSLTFSIGTPPRASLSASGTASS